MLSQSRLSRELRVCKEYLMYRIECIELFFTHGIIQESRSSLACSSSKSIGVWRAFAAENARPGGWRSEVLQLFRVTQQHRRSRERENNSIKRERDKLATSDTTLDLVGLHNDYSVVAVNRVRFSFPSCSRCSSLPHIAM